MTSVEVAIEASYKECGITPDVQPFRGGTTDIITIKRIPTQTYLLSRESSHGHNMNS